MEDQLIIKLFNDISEEAIEATSKKYGKLCTSISRNILNNSEDAEECVNDTYLALWNSIPPAKPDPLSAYICKITRNLSLKKYRFNTQEKRNSYYDASIEELEEILVGKEDITKDFENKELTDAISRFLDRIKKVDRVMFVKRYWFCMDIDQIAEEMGLSRNYINVHLHRTREKLKNYLIEENYDVQEIV